jgi:Sigma-70 region 2
MEATTHPGVEDLYREHALGLVRFALLLTGDRATAEDVVQDAFLGLHRHWDEVRDPGHVLACLRTAVVNGSRSRHRRHLVTRRLCPEPLAFVQSAEASVLGRATWFDVAVTGSGTRFVVAAAPVRGGLCNPTYLYTLTLSASGALASLRPTDASSSMPIPDSARAPACVCWTPAPRRAAPLQPARSSTPTPPVSRALSVTLDTDSTTIYVMWLTGPDGYHLTRTLAGYRIGPRGMQSTLFRRTVPAGMLVSRAGRELLVWDPGVTSTWSTP